MSQIKLSEQVREHHEQQFGRVSWERLATKLGEEVGELQGAIIRDTERRDGRRWRNEMFLEMQDVLTVLHVIAARIGADLGQTADEAGRFFLTREFTNIEKCESE